MNAEDIAQKYYIIAQKRLNAKIQNLNYIQPSYASGKNVVPFKQGTRIDKDNLELITKQIIIETSNDMLRELWRCKETYDYVIESMSYATKLFTPSMKDESIRNIILQLRQDYSYDQWEKDNQIFAEEKHSA